MTRETEQYQRKIKNLQRALDGREKRFYLSKKFNVTILATVYAVFGSKFGFTLPEIQLSLAPVIVYVISQAIADFGKNKRL